MSAVGKYKITINQGTTFRFGFSSFTDEVIDDLTGSEFTLYIRDSHRSKLREYELELDNNVVRIELDPEETLKLNPHNTYYYVIDRTYPSGDVDRLLEGPIYVRPSAVGV
jgi:hypothetical protein